MMVGQKNLSFQDDTPKQIERIAQNRGWSQSKVVSKAVDLLDSESFEAQAEGDLYEIKQRLEAIEDGLSEAGVPSLDEQLKKKDSSEPLERTRDIPEADREVVRDADDKYISETGVRLDEYCPASGNGLNKPERTQVFYELALLNNPEGIIDLEDLNEAIAEGWGDDSTHMVDNYRPKLRSRLNENWINIVDQGDVGIWVESEDLIFEQVQNALELLQARLTEIGRDGDPQEAQQVKRQFASLHGTATDYDIDGVNTNALIQLIERAEEFREDCEQAGDL